MKIDIVIKFDVKVVAHSEVVQNTSTTPKLSIPHQHFECQNEKIHKQKSENDEN